MLIALSAKKRCGKDTVANFMEEFGVRKYALAYPIKFVLHQALVSDFGIDGYLSWEDINGESDYDREKPLNITDDKARSLMNSMLDRCNKLVPLDRQLFFTPLYDAAKQRINTVVEDFDGQWSVRTLMQYFGTDVMVHTDTMYWMRWMAHEYLNCIHNNVSMVVTDVRQDHELNAIRAFGAKVVFITRLNTDTEDSHITEKGLTPGEGDYFITNDSTLEELRQQTLSFLKDL